MPVKVLEGGSGSTADIAAGIRWAVDHGANVINMSFGGTYSSTIASAIDYATARGVLVVAAAGNNGNSSSFYPAADAGVLSVAGTQSDDSLYPWSNYGSWVSVAAPGCDLTTIRGGQYGEFCGTSASAPVVSGLAALAMSYSPSSSAEAIKLAITSSGRTVGGVTNGRVDFANTLAALGATFLPAPPAPPPSPVAPSSPTAVAGPSGGATQSAAPPARVREAVPGRRIVRFPHATLRHGWRTSRSARHLRLELLRRGR
jgi:subtilisin family serine protease